MEYSQLGAPPPLDAIVHCFWFLRGTAGGGSPQPVVADGRFDIILHLGDPFLRLDDTGVGQAQDDALLAGQLTRPIHLVARGAFDIVGIRLRTAAASLLCRTPPQELTDQVAPLGELHPKLRARLLDALRRVDTVEARRDALVACLGQFVRHRPDPLAAFVVRQLDRPDAISLPAVAADLGISRRSLERRVMSATGLAPQALRRTLRFRRAFRLLEGAAPGGLTRAAVAAGYFDQAHCIREFRRFTGQSPSAFFGSDPHLARALLEP